MTLEDYILRHTDAEPEYLTEIERNSYLKMINPRMCSGHLQGRILSMMCQMIQPVFALEIGTFTGYSALCIAESIPENGQLDTIEKDDELEDLIRHNLQISPFKDKINLIIGDAIEIIPALNKEYDLVFLDGDKREYSEYFNLVFPKVRKGGFIFADNTLWNGKVIEQAARNDKQTLEILHFNDALIDDDRIEKVILPIRDGLTIIRKK